MINWLRGNIIPVNVARLQFISIVNCTRWNVCRPAYTSLQHPGFRKRTNRAMAATSEDGIDESGGRSGNPSAATRTLIMQGNRIDSRELLASEREIIITHGDDAYRLRLTSQNKLILTK
jgi:hemin uptake protein HemP